MRGLLLTLLLVSTSIVGCLSDEQTPDPPAATNAIIEAGAVHVEVPVPIFLIGFSDETETDLVAKLQDTPFPSAGALTPTADYQVHAPSADWQEAFDAFIATAGHPGNPALTGFTGNILDGNLIEDYLGSNLATIHAVPDGINALVVLDIGERGHAYHYAGDVGWREPVRLFGEHQPILVWDPHAEVDPWVGSASLHHRPSGQATADEIAAWVERATAIRALQMPIWPTATSPCHAVTVVLAVRSGSLSSSTLGLQSWEEVLDVERMQATFENLTGDPVHVDLSILRLPEDDPALAVLTRENSARAITQTYLDLNFDAYHVPHEGCEPYLSLVVYGDLVDQRTSSNGNAAMMTPSGHRISTSLVAENVRVMSEVIGYNDQWDESTTFERVGPGADPHEWFNWVVNHETGHLFSLPHPNYSTGSQSFSDPGFASTWNVMGYQMRRIVTETSQVDTNNLLRNQAAYAVLAAQDSGVPDTQLEAALGAMSEYRWKDATRIATQP